MVISHGVIQAENNTKMATETPDIRDGCRIEKFTVFSAKMQKEVKAWAVLPPLYQTDLKREFPVLVTLHGWGAPYVTWAEMAPLRKKLHDKPMIVVGFEGEKSYFIDAPGKDDSQFTHFFFEELLPFIDSHYRVDGNRLAVTGFSMGGFGSFHYALTQPDRFTSVSGLSSFFPHLDRAKKKHNGSFSALLGTYEDNAEIYKSLDPYLRLESIVAAGHSFPPVYLHCGTDDVLLAGNQEMAEFLKKNKVSIEFLETEGGHNWDFWVAASADVIDFHWRYFNK